MSTFMSIVLFISEFIPKNITFDDIRWSSVISQLLTLVLVFGSLRLFFYWMSRNKV